MRNDSLCFGLDRPNRFFQKLLFIGIVIAMLNLPAYSFSLAPATVVGSTRPTDSVSFPYDTTSSTTTTTRLHAGSGNKIRFLGKGPDAIVRPGVVLVAPTYEFHHFYRQAAIFVYAMGEDEEGVYVIRGAIIDHPTPFTLAEMMEGGVVDENNPLGNNLMFRGGPKGGTGVMLLHNQKDIGQSEIGLSGIYQGGWQDALKVCAEGKADVSDFKAFFNYCEFTEEEIEELLEAEEAGDAWCSVEIPYDMVLSEEWDRGDCWKQLRNAVAPYMRQNT